MKDAMSWQIFVWISFLLSFNQAISCSLNSSYEYISLSNSVSYLFQELGLLKDSKWAGASEYHPIDRSEFQGTIYYGGVYLSIKSLKKFKNKVVFFDQSRDLEKNLKRAKIEKAIEVNLRLLEPWDALDQSLKLVSPYLKDCDNKIAEIAKYSSQVQNDLKKLKVLNKRIFFFLGSLKNKKKNSNMMVLNDGFVKSLITSDKILSYPSGLAYFIPSQRILRSYPKSIWIGLSSKIGSGWAIEKTTDRVYSIESELMFSAGLGHLKVLKQILKFFESIKS